MKRCSYCGAPAIKTFKNGKHCCKSSSQQCPAVRKKNSLAQRGRTYEEIYGEEALHQKRKRAIAATGREAISQQAKEKLSRLARERSLGGYRENVQSKRHKRGWYNGVWCDSSWELAYLFWLDSQNIPYKRNNVGFPYKYKGTQRLFYPDFIVNGIYIEIKGIVDDLAKAKIEQFPGEIQMLCHADIKPALDFVKKKYGVMFWEKLYSSTNPNDTVVLEPEAEAV